LLIKREKYSYLDITNLPEGRLCENTLSDPTASSRNRPLTPPRLECGALTITSKLVFAINFNNCHSID
jgi:hypothetical protein